MKGIVLHGGSGTWLRPLTHTGPRQLIPIANKPVSQYAVKDLLACGIKEIAFVVGDVHPEKVKDHYGNGSAYGAKFTYILQEEPKAIAHAVGLCRDFVGSTVQSILETISSREESPSKRENSRRQKPTTPPYFSPRSKTPPGSESQNSITTTNLFL